MNNLRSFLHENGIKGFHLYAFGRLRQLYDWVLSWADHKYGTLALFGLSFAEASFFPVPPDPLQIALSVSKPQRSYGYAFVSMIGSVLGGILGYFIGAFLEPLGRAIITALGPAGAFETVGQLYADNAFWAIFASALSPIPYKVFTISAGIWSLNLGTLILASAIGRGTRFFAVATLLHFFGPRVKNFIDRYFNILTLVFLILLIGGFYVVKYLF